MSQISPDSRRAQALDQIYEVILARFPLLRLLQFSDDLHSNTAPLPAFVGLIATILGSTDKPCCIVLPDCKDVAIAVSTLLAVSRFRDEFPEILRTHASVSFKERNDHVLVHPCGLVYRYEGFFTPALFRLKVVDRNESRSLPVTEIARLEKTTRKRPRGLLNSDLGQSQPTILGSLLGIKTAVNRNFLRNRVLVLGARKGFVEALDRWTMLATSVEGTIRRTLKDEVPFGKVVEGGKLSFLDDYVEAGEPLVAIASRADDLATHCTSIERFTKSVLIDEIEYLTRDLRAYDSITENQHTLILASDTQRESVHLLEERGCEVWRLTPDEILFGATVERQDVPLRNVVIKASSARNLVISALPCGEENLNRAAMELKGAAEAISSSDNGAIRELLSSLFRMLMFCAEYLGQDSERFSSAADKLLQSARQHLDSARVWLTTETNNRIGQAIDDMQIAVKTLSQCGVTPKGKVLLENLKTTGLGENQIAVLVSRGETNCAELRQWLSKSGADAEIYSISEIPENKNFDRILVVSWPRWERFDHLVHQYATDELRLLAYRFEEQWLNRYRQRYKRSVLPGISTKRKKQLLGLSSDEGQNDESEFASESSQDALVQFDVSEERFLTKRKVGLADQPVSSEGEREEMVDACYVDFAGPTFAYLTDGHELPVLNTYVSGEQVSPGKIPLRSVGDLNEGDYIMFRESGDSDIIRFLAEDEIGKAAYQQLRLTAGRWRAALHKLGTDPRLVWGLLRAVGFSRHLQTVRGWLVNQSRICPQDMDDVRKIAEASHDDELLNLLPGLEHAKDELMSLHIRAGYRLTELLQKELPDKIGLLGQGETELDLGVGKVWVVHIQEIDRSFSPQRRSQINRLLWDMGS
ncbi:MAG TPA: DrmE family protein [Candidatus Acidoferrales bacterium]|nr:DrmE family protein [Candidatus Acidoferrales bacterium]